MRELVRLAKSDQIHSHCEPEGRGNLVIASLRSQ